MKELIKLSHICELAVPCAAISASITGQHANQQALEFRGTQAIRANKAAARQALDLQLIASKFKQNFVVAPVS